MTNKHRDSGTIVAGCLLTAAVTVILLQLYALPTKSPAAIVEVAKDLPTSPAAVEASSLDPTYQQKPVPSSVLESTPLVETLVFGEMTLECFFEERPEVISGSLRGQFFMDWFVLKENRALYEAIAMVEGDDGKIGSAGERGRYRITPGYWKDSCKEIAKHHNTTIEAVERLFDYDTCVELRVACEIIMKHFWQRYGGDTDEKKMALHVAGPTGIAKMKTSAQIQEYIQKVKTYMRETL